MHTQYKIGHFTDTAKQNLEYYAFPGLFIPEKDKALTFFNFPKIHAEWVQKDNPEKEIVIIGDDV